MWHVLSLRDLLPFEREKVAPQRRMRVAGVEAPAPLANPPLPIDTRIRPSTRRVVIACVFSSCGAMWGGEPKSS